MSGRGRGYSLADVHRQSGQLIKKNAVKNSALPLVARPPMAQPPAWAAEWVKAAGGQLVTVRHAVPGPIDGPTLERLAFDVYEELFRRIEEHPNWHPVRIWNFLPGILGDADDGLNRYMRFNVGRYRAFKEWLGCETRFDERVPAASAVGTDADELVIHALLWRTPGVAVHNPRQHAPHRYSARFGPLPPCFARATRVDRADGRRDLFVGGTASVRGEDSVHVGELRLQLEETLRNLAEVARAAFNLPGIDPLNCYRELRVYHPRASDGPAIAAAVGRAFPALVRVEFLVTDLCRPDLLVEVEGLACDPASGTRRTR